MSIIEVKDVYYKYESKYQTTEVLKGISCSFEEGKFYALVGKSGSGKSTLLSLMGGLMLPMGGEVLYQGVPTAELDLDKYRREKAAVIYQSFRLLPLLTVEENVTYPMELRGVNGQEARDKAHQLIDKVDLQETVLNRLPGMLSGGEQQRVAIARALSMDSKILLADEPTGNLDSENSDRIIDLLLSFAHDDGYCVIVVTHDLEIASKADCVYQMKDGLLYEK